MREIVLRIARDRDRGAFEELFDHFAPRLAGFFRQANLPTDVREDLVQEVLLRVWRHAAQYDPARATVDTWVFAIARNVRTDHFRRPATRARVEALDPAYVDDGAVDPEEEAVRLQQAVDVRTALRGLPPEQADVLDAAYFRHKTLRDVASDLGIALGTVKSRVRLAFARLRRSLGRKP